MGAGSGADAAAGADLLVKHARRRMRDIGDARLLMNEAPAVQTHPGELCLNRAPKDMVTFSCGGSAGIDRHRARKDVVAGFASCRSRQGAT